VSFCVQVFVKCNIFRFKATPPVSTECSKSPVTHSPKIISLYCGMCIPPILGDTVV